MSHSRTRRNKLARRLAREDNISYQQALQRVITAADQGLLPDSLFDEGMNAAIGVLTRTAQSSGEPTPSPIGNVRSGASLVTPETVNGFPVLESRPLPIKPGLLPGFAVLCDRGVEDTIDRYVVWTVVTDDGGTAWQASYGLYTHVFTDALDDLDRRAPRSAPALLDSPRTESVWTAEDYQMSERVERLAKDAVLAVEDALPPADRQRILDRFKNGNLNGAAVADILDILDNHDELLEFTEPFYETGGVDQVRQVLGWPTRAEDRHTDFTCRPDRPTLHAQALRVRLIGHAVLAIALLTDAVPDVTAVTALVQRAAVAAAERWPDDPRV